jgi:hypothetical protein
MAQALLQPKQDLKVLLWKLPHVLEQACAQAMPRSVTIVLAGIDHVEKTEFCTGDHEQVQLIGWSISFGVARFQAVKQPAQQNHNKKHFDHFGGTACTPSRHDDAVEQPAQQIHNNIDSLPNVISTAHESDGDCLAVKPCSAPVWSSTSLAVKPRSYCLFPLCLVSWCSRGRTVQPTRYPT